MITPHFKAFLFCLFLLFSCKSFLSAQPCQEDVFAGLSCDLAPILCDIHSFCDKLPSSNALTPPPGFCGAMTNVHWIGFPARNETMLISISLANCVKSLGMHGRLYKGNDCGELVPAAPCWNEEFPYEDLYVLENLVVGDIYYLVFDGIDADVCEYRIFITAGNVPLNMADAGPDLTLCEDQTQTLDGSNSLQGDEFSYQWSSQGGQILTGSQGLAPTVSGLGTYFLSVSNIINGCVDTDSMTISEIISNPLMIDLPSTISVNYGEEIVLNPFLNVPLEEITSVAWSPTQNLNCTSCLSPTFTAFSSGEYELHVQHINGCVEQVQVKIDVANIPDQVYFLPNVFSPNDDGFNDYWTIQGGAALIEIKYMRIFTRWGDLVFEQKNIPPNQAHLGWNGRKNNRTLPSGVYYMEAEVLLADGHLEQIQSTINLIR